MTTRILPGVLAASGSQQYKVEKSLRLNKLDGAGLQKTFSTSGNRKIYTISFWVKFLEPVGYIFTDNDGGANANMYIYVSGNRISYWDRRQDTEGSILLTNNVFLDNASWYHLVLSVNYSAATASNRAKLYINGVEASYESTNYPNTSEDSYWNRANTHYISAPGSRANCLLAELNVIDGQSLTAASFGEFNSTTGAWQPKQYTGTYGTNGYYLPFKDNSSRTSLGIDPNKISDARENASVTGSAVLSTTQSKFGGSSIYQPTATGSPVNFRTGAAAAQDYLFEGDFTIEGWVYPVSGPDRSFYVSHDGSTYFAFNYSMTGNVFNLYLNSGGPTSPSFTFSSQWYHFALSRSGTGSNNLKLFVNGNIVWQSTNNSSLGYANPTLNRIGGGAGSDPQYVDDFRIYNGVGKYTTTFTPPTSALPIGSSDPNWSSVVLAVPADGSNNSTTIPTYYANYFSPVNVSVLPGVNNDSLVDSPTSYGIDTGLGGEVRGNYATIDRNTLFAGTLSDSNLKIQGGNDCIATIGVRSGKWYWESTIEALGTGGDVGHWGITAIDHQASENFVVTNGSRSDYILRRSDVSFGQQSGLGSITSITNPVINYNTSVGETLSFQLDLDSTPKTLVAKIGSTTVLNASFQYNGEKIIYPFFRNNANTRTVQNFGQRPFVVAAPSGFKALCTQNLPDPSIIKPSLYFDTILYTGNGATSSAGTTARTISGLNFSPDMLWVKSRDTGGGWDSHSITDSVRGANLSLSTDNANAQVNVTTDFGQGGVGSFTSSGFNIVSGTGGGTNNLNNNTTRYVAWAWDATTTVTGNTSGGVAKPYTERYSPTAGFSIIKYLGNLDENHTVPHSLGEVPDFAMIKALASNAYSWPVYHRDLPRGSTESGYTTQGGWLALNATDTFNSGDTSYIGMSSSGVRLNDVGGSWSNDNDREYMMYLWKEVPGYSKFGIWNNNNGTNGSFITCDFKPAWIMLKNTDNVEAWYIVDNKRAAFNVNAPQGAVYLKPNTSGVDVSTGTAAIDMYSNGFKIKTTNPANGEISFGTRTYIYAAFAEAPFKYALAR